MNYNHSSIVLGLQVADLRLIFRAAAKYNDGPQDLYAYVLWYAPTLAPSREYGLREVQKKYRGGLRAGGVIKLSDIRGSAPLHSCIIGDCPPGIDQYNALEKLDSFWINPFEGHVDYEMFR